MKFTEINAYEQTIRVVKLTQPPPWKSVAIKRIRTKLWGVREEVGEEKCFTLRGQRFSGVWYCNNLSIPVLSAMIEWK